MFIKSPPQAEEVMYGLVPLPGYKPIKKRKNKKSGTASFECHPLFNISFEK
jgi:hypothetical protein